MNVKDYKQCIYRKVSQASENQDGRIIKNYFNLQLQQNDDIYNFIGLINQTITNSYSCLLWRMYPINQKGQIIRVVSPSLRVELNKIIKNIQFYKMSSTFQFVIHPLSGQFYIQSSFSQVNFKQEKNKMNNKQKDKALKENRNSQIQLNQYQKIIKQNLESSRIIKKKLIKILKIIEQGCILYDKKEQMNEIVKYGFNSQLYAWISPLQHNIQQDSKKLDINDKQNDKKQVWSDFGSDDDMFDSQTNQSQSSQQSKQNNENDNNHDQRKNQYQSINTYKQTNSSHLIKQKLLTEGQFYKKNRKIYKQLGIYKENIQQNRFQQIRYDKNNMLIKYYMSEEQDQSLSKKYLAKYTNLIKKVIIQYSDQDDFNQIYDNEQSSEEQNPVIKTFVQKNYMTISKANKLKIINQMISLVYQDFVYTHLYQKKYYVQTSTFHISKSYIVIRSLPELNKSHRRFNKSYFSNQNIKNYQFNNKNNQPYKGYSEETDILNLANSYTQNHIIYSSNPYKNQSFNSQYYHNMNYPNQNYSNQYQPNNYSNQYQTNNYYPYQTQFQSQQKLSMQLLQQKKLASILLALFCVNIFPQKYFMPKISQSYFQLFNHYSNFKKDIRIHNIDKWLQNYQIKFKHTNFNHQIILLYLHQKLKFTRSKGSYGDWVAIISNKIQQIYQKLTL